MLRLSWLSRVFISACLLLISTSYCCGQITNASADQQVPIPGAGHDYIHMLTETVSPANGSLSVRIQVPIPKGRGLTLPFSFTYDSNGIHYPLNSSTGLPLWATDGAGGGWRYTAPSLGWQSVSLSSPTCIYFLNYMFFTPLGERHALDLSAWEGPYTTNCSQNPNSPAQYLTGGDDDFQASSNPSNNAVTVADADGTVYYFPKGEGYASRVEDRNGNEITITSGTNLFTETDTAGRAVLSASSFGASGGDTITVSGLSNPYTVHWGTASYNYTPGWKLVQTDGLCANMVYAEGSTPEVTSITLPNGQSYKFHYNSTYGLLDEIDFPSGGWVKYTWGVNSLSLFAWLADHNGTMGCGYQYGQPAVVERQVSYDGTNIAQEQTFSYTTNWNAYGNDWTVKTTNSATTDELRSTSFTTAYTYSPVNVWVQPNTNSPVTSTQAATESQITYNDWSGTTLRTVNKSWKDPYLMACESTTQGGETNRTDYAYADYGAVGKYLNIPTVALMTDKKEWDWGQAPACGSASSGTPRRETTISYQSFAATPIYSYARSILDRPSIVTTYGNGAQAAQTQYAYDGTAVTGAGVTVGRDSTYNGNTTVPRGNATSKTEWLNGGTSPVTNYTYDDTGQMLTMKDPRLNTTNYSYADSYASGSPPGQTNAYLTQITYPNTGVAHTVKFSYNWADGQLASSTDQNSNKTSYSYNDSLDRLTQISYPDGGQTAYSYNDAPPTPSVTTTKEITSSENYVSTSIMDGVGHVTRTELTSDPQGTDYTDITYDGEGLVWKQSNPYRSTGDPSYGLTTTAYDALGRTTSATYADSNQVLTYYGTAAVAGMGGNSSQLCSASIYGLGYPILTRNEFWWIRQVWRDALGRLIEVDETDPANGGKADMPTCYTYDGLDNLLSVTEGSQTRSFTYDSLSRQLTASNLESGAVTYTYDANGNVQTKKDARSITTTYSYDALNRLTSKSYSDGTPTANFSYDQSSATIGSWSSGTLTNTAGRMTEATTGSTQTGLAYGYDSMGRIVNYWQCAPYNCGSSAWAMTYNYDLAGDVNSWTHPAGFTITNQINGAQRITQITSSLNDATHPGTLATIGYTAWGAEQTLENGCAGTGCTNTVETYIYNNRLQPVMIELGTPTNASADYCLAYNFYANSYNPTSCTVLPQQGGDNGIVWNYYYGDNLNPSLSHSEYFAYDGDYRLTTAQATGNSTYNLTFSYDRYGNMTCAINGNTHGPCPQYTFNQSTNQISISGFTYDAAGDLTSDGTNSWQYDAEGRVNSANGYAQAYNALGAMASQVVPWTTFYLLYDPSGMRVATGESGGELWAQYVTMGSRTIEIYSADNQEMYFLHPSLLGSSTENTDQTGGTPGGMLYYPWGSVWQQSGNPWASNFATFDGRLMFRSYDSTPGRWLTPDPANAGADSSNPQTWNAYSYAGNNPTTNTDPSGLSYCKEDSSGNIDESSCVSDKDYQSLGTNVPGYVQVSHDVSVTVNGNDTTPEDYQAALVVGVQQAAPVVNGAFEALRGFGYAVAPWAMGLADYLAGAPGSSKAGLALAVLPDAFAAGEIAKIAAGLKPAAEGPELQAVINQLYREGDALAGGTAGAVRHELGTGEAVGGRFHSIKATQRMNQLNKLIANGKLSPNDTAIARALVQDLQSAVRGK